MFLFGNIPTEVQLDFVQEHFLDRIEEYPSEVNFSATPNVKPDFIKWETPEELKEPKKVSAVAPNVGATGSTVTLNWLCGNSNDLYSYLECAFLCEVLLGHDGSPLAKALTDSELGDDLAPYSGITGEMKSFFVSFGLFSTGFSTTSGEVIPRTISSRPMFAKGFSIVGLSFLLAMTLFLYI